MAAAPTSSQAEVRRVIDEELAGEIEDFFAEWDATPLGSASIGQVHRAVTLDGDEVAVKVQHPGVDAAMQRGIIELGVMRQKHQRRSCIKPNLFQCFIWPVWQNALARKPRLGTKSTARINDHRIVAGNARHGHQRLRNVNRSDNGQSQWRVVHGDENRTLFFET